MTQVVEILPRVRQELIITYSTWSISWMLMSWQCKEPGHQQPWYLLCWTKLTQSLHGLRPIYMKLKHFQQQDSNDPFLQNSKIRRKMDRFNCWRFMKYSQRVHNEHCKLSKSVCGIFMINVSNAGLDTHTRVKKVYLHALHWWPRMDSWLWSQLLSWTGFLIQRHLKITLQSCISSPQEQLEQLGCLCSEETPTVPWLPIHFDSYWIPSQNKMSKLQI